MVITLLLLLSAFIEPASSYYVDTGRRGEDMSLITGTTWNHLGSTRLNILKTDTPEYFRTHRSGPDFTYTIGGFVPGSSHNVSLGFAEIWGSNCFEGSRVFDISINNEKVRSNLDVFAEAKGCFTAHVETFVVEASATGSFAIHFE